MEDTMQGLEHYRDVRSGQKAPWFLRSRLMPVSGRGDPWRRHETAVAGLHCRESRPVAPSGDCRPRASLLDLKIDLAARMLDACDLCPHHCRVNRNRGETGYCGVAAQTAVHWEGILHGEEIELVPSHEVFLSGCTMRCAFCYSHAHITRPMSGLPMAPDELAGCAQRRHRQGATNLNLVGGEPTVHLCNILRALRLVDAPIPVVWNSNMYATPQAMALLDGIVDLYLGDIHFGSEPCAWRLGRIPDYLPSVQAALIAAAASGANLIIRHLVMPEHLDCCARPAMEWAARALPQVPFHLMFQYVPDYRAAHDPVLGRTLTPAEIRQAAAMAREIGVNLYREDPAPQAREDPRALRPEFQQSAAGAADDGIGETVDILIQGDGRVSFTRLLGGLLPVAAALRAEDARIAARTGRR